MVRPRLDSTLPSELTRKSFFLSHELRLCLRHGHRWSKASIDLLKFRHQSSFFGNTLHAVIHVSWTYAICIDEYESRMTHSRHWRPRHVLQHAPASCILTTILF
ncbi:hypothetical protein DENSPDRAFT_201039 [Dentipellis sp. KUC8613]|nr:hypothetical protein DENSPDRAFT_201039 [Dentipellis sp. KUC8613]